MTDPSGQAAAGSTRAAPWPPSPPLAPPASADLVVPPLTFPPGSSRLPSGSGCGTPPIVPAPASAPTTVGVRRSAVALVVPAVLAVAAVAVVATFLTWLRVGSSERTSFQVVRAAERLDVVGGAGQALFAVLWAFLPFAVALGVLALALDRRRLGAVVLLAAGLVEASFAALVLRAPGLAGGGARIGLVAALVLAALAVALLFVRSPRSSR